MGTLLSDDIATILVWEGRGVWWVWYVPLCHLAWTPEVDDGECQDWYSVTNWDRKVLLQPRWREVI